MIKAVMSVLGVGRDGYVEVIGSEIEGCFIPLGRGQQHLVGPDGRNEIGRALGDGQPV